LNLFGALGKKSHTQETVSFEDENRRLKAIVADQASDIRALKEVLEKTDTAHSKAADGCRT